MILGDVLELADGSFSSEADRNIDGRGKTLTEPNPECDLMGAWQVGCEDSDIRHATWGSIKAMFHQLENARGSPLR